MPYQISSFIVNPGDHQVMMAHVFFGETERDARNVYKEHLSHCKYMQGAEKQEGGGELVDVVEEIDELPTADTAADGTLAFDLGFEEEEGDDDENEEGEEGDDEEDESGG